MSLDTYLLTIWLWLGNSSVIGPLFPWEQLHSHFSGDNIPGPPCFTSTLSTLLSNFWISGTSTPSVCVWSYVECVLYSIILGLLATHIYEHPTLLMYVCVHPCVASGKLYCLSWMLLCDQPTVPSLLSPSMQFLLIYSGITWSLVKNVRAYVTQVMWLHFSSASLLQWWPERLWSWEIMDFRKTMNSLQVIWPVITFGNYWVQANKVPRDKTPTNAQGLKRAT